jgi:hypothetical protein
VTFGKRGGGGRRSDTRKAANLLAVVKTTAKTQSADLVDVSLTGAKLSGCDLPAVGQNLFIAFERVEVFATVVWSQAGECGIRFDEPISQDDLDIVQEETRRARLLRLTPGEKLIWDNWSAGQL